MWGSLFNTYHPAKWGSLNKPGNWGIFEIVLKNEIYPTFWVILEKRNPCSWKIDTTIWGTSPNCSPCIY